MSTRWLQISEAGKTAFPEGEELHAALAVRHKAGRTWQFFLRGAVWVGIVALALLLCNIVDQAFGMVAVRNKVDPQVLAVNSVPLEDLGSNDLVTILEQYVSAGVLRRLESERPLRERSRDELLQLIKERVVQETVLKSWPLHTSLFNQAAVRAEAALDYPDARLVFRSWLTADFVRRAQSSTPALAGVRTALLGSVWTIAITVLVALPMGVAAAVYLEEYARDSLATRVIQTNISNLAGVPSIIYGLLGLAIFVRGMAALTSGAALGVVDRTTANGRTILSAGLTLALLVLPLIIINAREAIRAVPRSLRDASYALGATRWQTVWHHVLPSALPGVLTGTILAMSRAMGETAPLVVVGASTLVTLDPNGPFSRFTTLPIQIYQWTSRPQEQFRNAAAAAILVLLILLLTLNAAAIVMRNRYGRRSVV